MKASVLLMGAAASAVMANPRMGHMMRGLALASRQAPPVQNVSLPGDLPTAGVNSVVAKAIVGCLNDASGLSCEVTGAKSYTPPGELGSYECAQDTCCVWDSVAKELVGLFTSQDGTCNSAARAAVRLGFHDAAAWSLTTGPGGADGSLILSSDEVNRSENNGLQDIRTLLLTILSKYSSFGVGAADLVQFSHNVAVVTCPLGPRQLTYIGRPSSAADPPAGLLPSAASPVTDLLQLFLDKTIGTVDLISLIGAHTTGTQRFVDPSKAGEPFDTTDGVWDVAFYSETLNPSPPPGTFRLASDNAFSLDNRTDHGFVTFADPATGQAVWNAFYSKAYLRLSLLGVVGVNKLVDCTKVLPGSKSGSPPSGDKGVSSSAPTYTTSTIYSTSISTMSEHGAVKYSTWIKPVRTTVCPVETKTPVAPLYPSTSTAGYAKGTGTGSYYASPAKYTGAANKNSLGLAAIVGAAAVAMF